MSGNGRNFTFFFRLLSSGFLQGSDESLNLLDDYVKVVDIKLSQIQTGKTLLYVFSDKKIALMEEGIKKAEIDKRQINEQAEQLLKSLLHKTKTTFPVKGVSDFLKVFGNPVRKSKTQFKRDITLSVLNPVTLSPEEYGFSIKSNLAGKSTLVNASSGTNFTYLVDIPVSAVKSYPYKAKTLLKKLPEQSVSFTALDSGIFEQNIQLIDTQMPQILSQMLLTYFSSDLKNVSQLLEDLKQRNPLNLSNLETYTVKMGEFLLSTALGMVPKTPWNRLFNADGGFIVVKENGELATFYIFKQQFFENFKKYLLSHAYLDTPSTTRHKFGRLYVEDEKVKVKLNLQVRLK